MANRYWVGGTGTWDNSATTHWSTSSGGSSGASAPTSSDDVIVDTSSGNGNITTASTAACNNLTVNWTAVTTNNFILGANFAPAGNVSINGNSATNRVFIKSSVLGAQKTFTVNGTLTMTNVDLQDIISAGSASWNLASITGGSGNAGNCTGITFTTSATQTYSGGSANWSAATWTSRVPLPQDNVVISLSGTVGITVDMPRMCANLDMSGCTGAVTLLCGSNYVIYGSYKLSSTCIISGGGAASLNGYGTHTIDQAGKSIQAVSVVPLAGGDYTLLSNFTSTSTVLISNKFASGNFNIQGTTINTSGVASTATFGTSTLTCTATSATVFAGGGGGATTYTSATVVISTTSSSSRTVTFGGKSYGTFTYTVAGSTGALVIGNQSSTVGTFNFSDASNARTLTLPSSFTNTFTNFNVSGSSGKIITIVSTTSGTPSTISKSSGLVSTDYVSIKDITATGGAAFYAGAHSTDVSGNTGWTFTAPPSLSDTISWTESIALIKYLTLTDSIGWSDSVLKEDAITLISLTDSISVSDDLLLTNLISITDSISIDDDLATEVSISLEDSISFTDEVSAPAVSVSTTHPGRTLREILVFANAYINLESSVPIGDDLDMWTNYANRAVWEASALAQFSEFDQVYIANVSLGPTFFFPEKFREFLSTPSVNTNGAWQDYPEIDPRDILLRSESDRYCYLLGSPLEGYRVIFNNLPSTGNIYIYYQRFPTGFASLDDVCELPDPMYVVRSIESYVLQSRSDDRFPRVEADRQLRLQNMIGRENKPPGGGANSVKKTGASAYSIG